VDSHCAVIVILLKHIFKPLYGVPTRLERPYLSLPTPQRTHHTVTIPLDIFRPSATTLPNMTRQ